VSLANEANEFCTPDAFYFPRISSYQRLKRNSRKIFSRHSGFLSILKKKKKLLKKKENCRDKNK
jgi:hypothetical protein